MPSPATSSSRRAPDGPWWRTWLLAIVLAVAAGVSLEVLLRRQGHRPSVVDDMDLWAMQRRTVDSHDDGPRPVAVLGASRIRLAFSPGTFERDFPDYRVVVLAVEGTHALATLRDLACDERFAGVVIFSCLAQSFEPRVWDDQQAHVANYERLYANLGWLDRTANRSISVALQERLVLGNPHVRPDAMIKSLLRSGALPGPLYLITYPDRSRQADFRLADLPAVREMRIEIVQQHERDNLVSGVEEWSACVRRVKPWVDAIRARGGGVAFVRCPTTGESWRVMQKLYPKARYWDRISSLTGAVTVHFREYPELRDFACPDTSHIDSRDAPRFTRALADILRRQGVLAVSR